MLSEKRMMREARTALPWLGVRALGWGGGFVVPMARTFETTSRPEPEPAIVPAVQSSEWRPVSPGGRIWFRVVDGIGNRSVMVWKREGVTGGAWSSVRPGEFPVHGHETAAAAAACAMGE